MPSRTVCTRTAPSAGCFERRAAQFVAGMCALSCPRCPRRRKCRRRDPLRRERSWPPQRLVLRPHDPLRHGILDPGRRALTVPRVRRHAASGLERPPSPRSRERRFRCVSSRRSCHPTAPSALVVSFGWVGGTCIRWLGLQLIPVKRTKGDSAFASRDPTVRLRFGPESGILCPFVRTLATANMMYVPAPMPRVKHARIRKRGARGQQSR